MDDKKDNQRKDDQRENNERQNNESRLTQSALSMHQKLTASAKRIKPLYLILLLLGGAMIFYGSQSIITENEVRINAEISHDQGLEAEPRAREGERRNQYSGHSREPGRVLVYLTGAVENPGLYEIPQGANLGAAIKAGGGFLPYADTESVNLASPVQEGSHLHIPFNFQGNPEELVRKNLVNINLASLEELDKLPGIGPGIARRIEEHRQKAGAFERPEDIKKIKGIGDGIYEKIKDKITV